MQVFIRTPCGKCIPVEVNSRTSIAHLRRHIEAALGSSLHPHQRFLCQDIELKEHDIFASYDIAHGMTIFLTPPRPPCERIFVLLPSGIKHEVLVSPRETVEIVKKKIEQRGGIPASQQCLSFRGLELLNEWTLAECSVTPNSVLSLSVRPDHKIFIQVFSGAVFPLYVWPSDTIHRVKERIAELRRYPVDQQELRHEWRDLEDSRGLAESGVVPGETLFLTLRTTRPPLHLHIDGGPRGKFSVRLDAGSYVSRIQERIQAQLGIPISRQRLSLNGRELTSGRSLADCGATDEAVLRVEEKETEIRLVVEYRDRPPLILPARTADSVASVKERIEEKVGVLRREQRLTFCGRVLDDERTLGECGVGDAAIIFLSTLGRPLDDRISVRVLLPSGDCTRLHVPPHATVSDLRIELQRKEAIVGRIELFLNGKPLYDDDLVEESELKGDSILVVRHIPGQAPPEVFISYQWDSQTTVKALFKRLEKLGYSCWMDESEMGGGDKLYEEIDRGLRECKVVIACVTPKYTQSLNCRREMCRADNLKKPILPLLLKDTKWLPDGPMALIFTDLLYIDMYNFPDQQVNWKGEQVDRLIEQLSKYTSPG